MNQLIQVAELDKASFPRLDVCRRVYSPDGIAPTIHTCGGGGQEPKILVTESETDQGPVQRQIVLGLVNRYLSTGCIYDIRGLCPAQRASQGKDPPKVVIP